MTTGQAGASYKVWWISEDGKRQKPELTENALAMPAVDAYPKRHSLFVSSMGFVSTQVTFLPQEPVAALLAA